MVPAGIVTSLIKIADIVQGAEVGVIPLRFKWRADAIGW